MYLEISRDLHENIIRDASNSLPAECCGLLAGIYPVISEVFSVRNILNCGRRYQMDPVQQIEVFNQIEEKKMDLLAIYHSHPDGSSKLSNLDIEEFNYPGVFSVLLFHKGDEWKMKVFQIDGSEADETPLIISS